jgi:hypothetical protein
MMASSEVRRISQMGIILTEGSRGWWFFVGTYTMADTISDLLVDSGGALAAALVALALRRSGDRLT